jgi:thiosulfate dehydrogenase
MKMIVSTVIVAILAGLGALAWYTGYLPGLRSAKATFTPPPDSEIPAGKFGDEVRFGEEVFREPATHAAKYIGNDLRCSNCHLQAGRLAGASPMWAAYVAYPAYRTKNEHVNSFQTRLQGCFRYSMNGKVPPLGDPVLVALESYSYFLAKGLPIDEPAAGRGFPALPKPSLSPEYSRGALVYAQQCATCHGADGLGQSSAGKLVFPPLWGPRSYNWGAGMTSIKSAAEFIQANMPFGLGKTLSVQQAWDVATYIDSQTRPQDPRFRGDVAETRAKYHDNPFSMYGDTVNGMVLGDPASTPPFGTVPGETPSVPEAEEPPFPYSDTTLAQQK